MKAPRRSDIPHKIALYSLLTQLLKNQVIAQNIYFKGGTCAAMLGYLDRFSVDLDFDLPDKKYKKEIDDLVCKIIDRLGHSIKDRSKQHLQFYIQYPAPKQQRNTLKLEIVDLVAKSNKYESVYLPDVDMYCQAQTIETMFANKMVATIARFEKTGKVAGRDIYDLHHFFTQGYGININVVEELRQTSMENYIGQLIDFVEIEVTEKLLQQDLNVLLPKGQMNAVVDRIKPELLIALRSH